MIKMTEKILPEAGCYILSASQSASADVVFVDVSVEL